MKLGSDGWVDGLLVIVFVNKLLNETFLHMIPMKYKCAWHTFTPPTNRISGILESADSLMGGRSVGEMLCLKLLPQFSSHLHETCYTQSLWCVDVHNIICVRPCQRGPSIVMRFFWNTYIHLDKVLCLLPQSSKWCSKWCSIVCLLCCHRAGIGWPFITFMFNLQWYYLFTCLLL